MKLTLASLQHGSAPMIRPAIFRARKESEDLLDYAFADLNAKRDYLEKNLRAAVMHRHLDSQCTFFTLPAFYWNVYADCIRNEAECLQLTAFYMSSLQPTLNALMNVFDEASVWKIILLAGTVGLFIQNGDNADFAVHREFDFLNYLLMINNFNKIGASLNDTWMGPKRLRGDGDLRYWGRGETPTGAPLVQPWRPNVRMTHDIQQPAPGGYHDAIDYALLPGCPIALESGGDPRWLPFASGPGEIRERGAKILFLICCGEGPCSDPEGRAALQYAVCNDGDAGSKEAYEVVATGSVTVMGLSGATGWQPVPPENEVAEHPTLLIHFLDVH